MKESIKELYKIQLQIKQPNDLLLNNKKIAGILTQTSTYQNKVQYILIGIGMNINETEFSESTKKIATSLKNEYKSTFSKEDIIIKFIQILEEKLKNEEYIFNKSDQSD
ncbi:MAG: hypothetical protein HFJ53_06485 [Clostridia bacterium]|jgi:BirA family biotin operon repressor/biotin-[acetyl-CoA-carboxylase] ligase|nr:hypothetical protein [Clostridia bacterium]